MTRADESGDQRLAVEARTREWLETNYRQALAGLGAGAERLWDDAGNPRQLSRYRFQEIQRKLKIFRWLDRLQFDSFIDIGSGFDVYPKLVGRRYGVPAYFSDFAHTMNLPYGGAASGKLDHAVTLNSARLPFADGAFDVVLASEVLEHLVRPVETIAELLRVSRKYVIMTSLEALAPSWWERWRAHLRVDVRQAHVERNFFLLHELAAIFGPSWQHENLIFEPDLPARVFLPPVQQDLAYAALRDAGALAAALSRAVAVGDHRPGAMGILLVAVKPGAPVAPLRAENDGALAHWLIEQAVDLERFLLPLARAVAEGKGELAAPDRPIAAELLARLRCPDCRAVLERAGAGVRCVGCGAVFPGEHGVPIVYPTRLPDGPAAEAETLGRLCGADLARQRIVRRVLRRLRRNESPPGVVKQWLWRALGGAN